MHRAGFENYCRTGERKLDWSSLEFIGLTKNGAEVPIESSMSETRTGPRRLITAIVRDIGKRKKDEEAVLAARERMELAQRIGQCPCSLQPDLISASPVQRQESSPALFVDLPGELLRSIHVGLVALHRVVIGELIAGEDAHRLSEQLGARLPDQRGGPSRIGGASTRWRSPARAYPRAPRRRGQFAPPGSSGDGQARRCATRGCVRLG